MASLGYRQRQVSIEACLLPISYLISGPLPNPRFVFPMQPEASNVTSRNYSNIETSGSRRLAGRSRPQRISINKLWAFDFSPAGQSPANRTPSPAYSPTKSLPPIHYGHRRNNSEYSHDIMISGASRVQSFTLLQRAAHIIKLPYVTSTLMTHATRYFTRVVRVRQLSFKSENRVQFEITWIYIQ